MNTNCGIYMIMNLVNGKFYIGSSYNINNRWNDHKSCLRINNHPSKYLQRAYNKYGKDNFIYEVLENCPENNLIEREQYWMDFHKIYLPENGYNISPTAGKTTGYKHTQESKEKVTILLKERISKMTPEERKEVFGKGRRNNPISKEHYEKLKEGLKKSGWLSSDRKKEITKLANFLKISKPILQYDKEGNFIAEFPNARLAGESIGLTGIKYRNINRVAKGGKWNKHRHAAYGYIWKYKNNINN